MTAASRKETAMWLLERLVPGTGVNNVIVAFEVDGRVDRDEFARAVSAVVAKHEILRTVFTADDTTLERSVLDAGVSIALADIPDTEADQDAFVGAPFALDGTPLVRAGVRSTANTDVCCVVVHHLVFDAMSTTILLSELLAAYEGRLDPTLVPPLAEREGNERSIAYWQKSLDGLRASESGLWCAKPEGAAATLRADTVHHTLSEQVREVVVRLQKELRASEAVILLAAYYVLLTQHGAGSDVVIGTPVNIRDQKSMNAIGYHANLLPLRVKLDPAADFRAVVKKTRSTFLEAISHADVPLEQVSPKVIGDQPSSWRSSFFRHLFNYVPGAVDGEYALAGMPARYLLVENGYSRFDLEFFIMPGPERTQVRGAFCVDAFDEADVRLLLERYDALLVELGSSVDTPVAELSRWGVTDRSVLAADSVAGPELTTVLEAVHAAVTADPAAVAIEEPNRVVTYGELWSAAVATRDVVTQAGASTVALIAPRGADLAAAWLGVWLAGAACVLLDPAQPPADLAARATDSGAKLILIEAGLPVPGGVPIPPIGGVDRPDAPDVAADAIAYLEYPLDAAEPVAVAMPHRALAAAVARLAGSPSATLWLSSAATNASVIELLVALTAGGRAVVSPDRARTDGQTLGDLLERHRIGLVQAPVAVWRQALEQVGGRLAGRTVLTGADEAVENRLRAAEAVVRTGYATPGVAGYATVDGVPTGRAFITEPGTAHELGIGVRGELCVAGPAVAAGYHNRPELTEARFAEHPVHGRFHRTGDLAHWRADGSLSVDGPLSAHVTVAGQRIHLSQVESALAPLVDAVAAIGDSTGIVVFVESSKPGIADTVREHARTTLPVAPTIVVLDRLPLTLASTVDQSALRAMAETVRSAPADDTEDETTASLVAIWRDLLGNPTLHADSNFFTSGGHSLLGAQLVQRVKKDLGTPVQLADLFGNPTPRALAAELQNAVWDDDEDDWDDDE